MNFRKVLFILLFTSVSVFSFSQSKKEKQVAAAVEKLRLAMISGERTELDAIASDILQYGHSGGKVESKQDFVETIASGKSDFVACDFSDIKITVDNKVAVVSFKLDAKTNDGGKPGEVHLKLMTSWYKQHGKWIMIARQAVKPPVQ
jgi:hypothetical protein